MPDKRNASKQRRQARNRATRDALAARTENANAAPTTSSGGRSSAGASSGDRSTGRATGAGARGAGGRGAARPRAVMVAYEPPPPGLRGVITSTRVGDKAVLIAFVLSVVAAAAGLLASNISVDDRGEPLPSRFAGLTIAAREAVTGAPVPDRTVTLLTAYGPIALMLVGTPVLICGFALWANRRPDRARVLTFSLMAMVAATILFPGTPLVFAPVIALGVAVFRIRKADLVTDAPAPAAGRESRGRDVVDVTEVSEGSDRPASLLDRLLGGGAAGSRSAPRARDDDVTEVSEGSDRPASFLDRLLGGGAAGSRSAPRARDDEAPEDEVADGVDDADGTAVSDGDPLAELEAELAAEDEAGDASSGSARRKG